MPSFEEALVIVQTPATGADLYRASASCFDEEDEYDRLGEQYEQAVATLHAAFGPPIEPWPRVNEPIDVEKLTCWHRPAGIVYVMLWFGDNTRIRVLEIGLVKRDTMFSVISADP